MFFIANLKGGHNKFFMYGIDKKTCWYDYDLIGAYITATACLENFDYSGITTFSHVFNCSSQALIDNYTGAALLH
jgi:hypothetical protein